MVLAVYLKFSGKKTTLETSIFSHKLIVVMTSKPVWATIFLWCTVAFSLLDLHIFMSRQHILIILFPWKVFPLLLLYNGVRVTLTSEPTPVRIPPCHFCPGYFKKVRQWCTCMGSDFGGNVQVFLLCQLKVKILWSLYPGALTVANINKIIMAKL